MGVRSGSAAAPDRVRSGFGRPARARRAGRAGPRRRRRAQGTRRRRAAAGPSSSDAGPPRRRADKRFTRPGGPLALARRPPFRGNSTCSRPPRPRSPFCSRRPPWPRRPRRAAPPPPRRRLQSEDARLAAFFDKAFKDQLALSPEGLTQIGSKDRYGELGDYTDAANVKQMELAEAQLAQMKRDFDLRQAERELARSPTGCSSRTSSRAACSSSSAGSSTRSRRTARPGVRHPGDADQQPPRRLRSPTPRPTSRA